MRVAWFLILAVLGVTVIPVRAEKTYAPEQLRKMVQSGNYPAQGPIAKEETRNMSWLQCLTQTELIIGAVAPAYPSVKLADTYLMTSTTVWLNDAAMTVACYADDRLHIASAPYT